MKTALMGFVGLVVVIAVGLLVLAPRLPYQLSLLTPPTTTNSIPSAPPQTEGESSTQSTAPSLPLYPSLKAAAGFQVYLFAENLQGPRDMVFSPTGTTLLVTETSAGKLEAIRLSDRQKKTVLGNLKRPHGIAFQDGELFLAEEERVVRYTWDEAAQTATMDKVLFSLPKGGSHFTRTIAFDDKKNLYVGIGSTCNVCEEKDERLAAVLISDADGKTPRVFAHGLRNPTFLARNPKTGQIWTSEMGRDLLGDNVPPDEINILQDNGQYGWPLCFDDKVVDNTQSKATSELCDTTVTPAYKIHAHSAPLGLQFITSPQFPADWQGDLLVSYHGSWNSSVPVGYKVVHLNVEGNKVTGEEDFITGFIDGRNVKTRPVDIEFDSQGSVYLSDDKSGKIFKISK